MKAKKGKRGPQVINNKCFMGECRGKKSYVQDAHCMNCAWQGKVRTTMGHDTIGSRFTCPRCGCDKVETR